MHRNYFFIILTLTALCLALILFFFLNQKLATEPDDHVPKVQAPFPTYINGVGIVEPQSGNIYIGIPFERIVKRVNVKVNDQVKKGDLLIELDHQDLEANLLIKQRDYETALANLQKLEALPREEDLVKAEETLKKTQAAFDEAKTQYEMVNNLSNPRAISKEEQNRRLYKFQQAEAELKDMQTQYDKIKAGAWQPDLKIARKQVKRAQAEIESIKTEIARTHIKSPINGTILQIKLHEGETPNSDPSHSTIIVGDLDELHLRVSVDQFNVASTIPNATAVAFRQGNRTTEFPLQFIHIEPYMIPKKYLTNSVEEQVDTQVFEILYRIAKKDSGLLIGEQMDVFIDKQK